MSRTTTYDPTLPERIAAYLDVVERGEHPKDLVPSIASICVEFNVARKLVYEWSKHHPEMGTVMDRAQEVQHRLLNNGGLSGRFNPKIATLLLGNLGVTSRQQIDHVSSDGSMTPQAVSAPEVMEALKDIASKL